MSVPCGFWDLILETKLLMPVAKLSHRTLWTFIYLILIMNRIPILKLQDFHPIPQFLFTWIKPALTSVTSEIFLPTVLMFTPICTAKVLTAVCASGHLPEVLSHYNKCEILKHFRWQKKTCLITTRDRTQAFITRFFHTSLYLPTRRKVKSLVIASNQYQNRS